MDWLDAQPNMSGRAGHAWDLLDQQRVAAPVMPDDACVAWWIVHAAPAQHPAWEWYFLSAVHLRTLSSQTRPAVLHFPAATHELLVLACDPDHAPPKPGEIKYLNPPNVCVQFACVEDANVGQVVSDIAAAIVDGGLHLEGPGGDVTSALGLDNALARHRSSLWRTVIDATLEHIVTGGHP